VTGIGGGVMKGEKLFGDFFKKKRRDLGLSLREFCRRNGFDPGNISRIERGLLSPPQTYEKRLEYAKALGISEGTDEWLEFCDLATVSAGKIPEDMVSNREFMNALPILFRTARRKELNEQELRELLDKIRREAQ
jgi:transcriptional regulator with XRE-family HTH domain